MNIVRPMELAAVQLTTVAALAAVIHQNLYDPTAPEWDAMPTGSQDKFKYAVQVFAKSGGPLRKETLPLENAAQLALLQWQRQEGILDADQLSVEAAMKTLGFAKDNELSVTSPPVPPGGASDEHAPAAETESGAGSSL